MEVLETDKRPVSAVADFTEVRDVVCVDVKENRDIALTLLFDQGLQSRRAGAEGAIRVPEDDIQKRTSRLQRRVAASEKARGSQRLSGQR